MHEWNLTETEMFPFFDMTPDLVCIAGRDGYFKKVNEAVVHKLQYSFEELYARPIHSFMHPEDRDLTLDERTKLFEGNKLVNFENRYLTAGQEVIWLNWTSVYLPEKEVVFAIAKDITERKRLEQEHADNHKKFKHLASHFKTKIEKDRTTLAYELHELLAQLASVIRMDLSWLSEQLAEAPGAVKARLGHASDTSRDLINTIRRMAFSLSPQMLEEFGLNETLDWLCKEFTLLNEIPCYFETSFEEADLSKEIKIDFFRICQEALQNVHQHAQATMARISVETQGDFVQLEVFDDGVGFDIDAVDKHKGLANMFSRASSFNGEFSILSSAEEGTTIRVTAPRSH